jgi:acyl carrier protein
VVLALDNLYRLQKVFREVFDDPTMTITPELAPGNFEDWDSVATVQIVLAIEEEFDLRLSTEEVAHIDSVKYLLNVIDKS